MKTTNGRVYYGDQHAMTISNKISCAEGLKPLFKRLRSGDQEALNAVYDAVAPWLLAFLNALTTSRHDAEECLQEVFIRLVRYRRRLGQVADPRAYLLAMAGNEAYRKLRRREAQAQSLGVLRRATVACSSNRIVNSGSG